MNKTISINPDLFSLSNKRKTKKKEKQNGEIKIKNAQKNKDKNKKIRKQHILRFLREKQEQNYKKLLENDKVKKEKPIDTTFNSDFEESVKYFDELVKNKDNSKHNFTSKKYPESNHSTHTNISIDPIHNDDLHIMSDDSIQINPPIIHNACTPSWGCLKNGNLPTFRDWKRSTQKNIENNLQDKKHEIRSMMIAKNEEKSAPKLKFIKQKKTIRRKYNVGRSNNISKVAVLVSNKTIRNNIMDKAQYIKQTPMDEIKKYLIKRGFIRVGTSAPNDVLRKMYETSNMVCGEIENHNADNLLFNYLNDT